MEKNLPKKKVLSPYGIISLGFLGIIAIGTLLFLLPISVNDGNTLNIVDAFFTSCSAVCVTGLSTIDVATRLSTFGKVILALLIQIGGLGLVTFAVFIITMIGVKLGIKDRVLIREALNQNSMSGLVKMVKTIFFTTIIIELLGAIINYTIFIQMYDWQTSIAYSVFHSISSFNNAGFDIFPAESLMQFSDNIWLNINTSLLTIVGGLGFIVLFDIKQNKRFSKLTVHSRIVICTTIFLIVSGMLLLKLTSWDNMSWLQALFQSVTARTAGFNTVSLNILSNASLIIIIFLMFVGASPGSTGGGIKTTTFFTIIKSIFSFSRGKETIVFRRRISDKSIYKAFYLAVLAMGLCILASFMIFIFDPLILFDKIIFEVFSAFGTVGLSLGITAELSVASKLILCFLMYFGRLGPITIASLLNTSWNAPAESNIHYVEEKIIIG